MKKLFLTLTVMIFLLISAFSMGAKEEFKCEAWDKGIKRLKSINLAQEIILTYHPDPFNTYRKELWEEKKENLKKDVWHLDDTEFAMRLSEIVALANDSHTTLYFADSFNPYTLQIIPASFITLDEGLVFNVLEKNNSGYLGLPIEKINGLTIGECIERISPYVASDNNTRLLYNVINYLYYKPVLTFTGIASDSDQSIKVEFSNGETLELNFIPYMENTNIDLEYLKEENSSTDYVRKNYFLQSDGNLAYIQYNVCQNDNEYPFYALVEELEKLDIETLIVDLRNNGGGSDGVISPLFDFLENNKNIKLYVLIGERTFSSAVINTAQLDSLFDAVLVGTSTGGSANHFGSTRTVRLPSGLRLSVSTKTINLDEYFGTDYGWKEIEPEVIVRTKLDDYKNGIDTAYEKIRKSIE